MKWNSLLLKLTSFSMKEFYFTRNQDWKISRVFQANKCKIKSNQCTSPCKWKKRKIGHAEMPKNASDVHWHYLQQSTVHGARKTQSHKCFASHISTAYHQLRDNLYQKQTTLHGCPQMGSADPLENGWKIKQWKHAKKQHFSEWGCWWRQV